MKILVTGGREFCDVGAIRAALLAASNDDYLRRARKMSDVLVGQFDASVWAREFVKTAQEKPEIASDEGWMLSWFANAIMAGYDRGRADERAPTSAEPPVDKTIWPGDAFTPPADAPSEEDFRAVDRLFYLCPENFDAVALSRVLAAAREHERLLADCESAGITVSGPAIEIIARLRARVDKLQVALRKVVVRAENRQAATLPHGNENAQRMDETLSNILEIARAALSEEDG